MPADVTRLERVLRPVDLPEGDRGKIVLVSVQSPEQRLLVVRGGDLWHRDILRNARAEVSSLGVAGVEVYAEGGAHLSFEADGSIAIWGGSEEFGACDREFAAGLVRAAWPDRTVSIHD